MSPYFSWFIFACGLLLALASFLAIFRKNPWKFLSRCVGGILLIAALSCAFTNEFGEWEVSKPSSIVVILDRSASMGAIPPGEESLLKQAVERIQSSIEKNTHSEWIILDSATKKQIPLASLEKIEPTDSSWNYHDLLLATSKILEGKNKEKSEIWVFSDMQKSNWDLNRNPSSPKEELTSSLLPPIRVISLRERPESNRAIRIDSSSVIDGHLILSFSISQYGKPRSAPISLSIQIGDRVMNETILPPPGDITRMERIIPVTDGVSPQVGSISIEEDDAPFDNKAYFTFATQPSPAITIACQSKQIAETLTNMAAPSGLKGIKTSFYRPWSSNPLVLDGQSLIIWQGIPPNTQQREAIEIFLNQGGYALFMPSRSQTRPLSLWNGIRWLFPHAASSEALFEISTFIENRGILRKGREMTSLPLHHVKALKKVPCEGENLRSLATWNDGTDAILSTPVGKGSLIIITTLPLYSWSNLADGSVLVPIIQRMASLGTRTQTKTFTFPVGSGKLRRSTNDKVYCILPSGNESQSPLLHAGVFLNEDSVFCANRPTREDDLQQISTEQLQDLIPHTAISEWSLVSKRENNICQLAPWWSWGITALLFLIIPEFTRIPSSKTS